jgi:hypothetical protein
MWHVGIWHEACAFSGEHRVYAYSSLGPGIRGRRHLDANTVFEMGVFPLGSTGIDFALGSLMGAEVHVISISSRFGGLGVRGLFDELGLFGC